VRTSFASAMSFARSSAGALGMAADSVFLRARCSSSFATF